MCIEADGQPDWTVWTAWISLTDHSCRTKTVLSSPVAAAEDLICHTDVATVTNIQLASIATARKPQSTSITLVDTGHPRCLFNP